MLQYSQFPENNYRSNYYIHTVIIIIIMHGVYVIHAQYVHSQYSNKKINDKVVLIFMTYFTSSSQISINNNLIEEIQWHGNTVSHKA